MILSYIFCSSCRYENTNTFAEYFRTTASGDIYLCPSCNKECFDFVK